MPLIRRQKTTRVAPAHHIGHPGNAALGGPRIRAGEIIGWRVWNLYNGLLHSVFVPYIWHPGIFERSNSKRCGYYNHGYHAFRDK
jgi:hypothetical protein